MSEEIIYTSAPRGLKTGSRGFCTVASTPGMASTLAALLESLSGYRHLATPGDAANPTVYSHVTTRLGGRELHILSRIADAGLDYSGRSNKLVHHVVVGEREVSPAGPAWVQQHLGFHERQWTGDPRILPAGRSLLRGDNAPRPCNAWQSLMGDAGWAGLLAESATQENGREVWLIYPPGADVLGLVGEAVALLPPPMRWKATYSTFFTKLLPGVECRWRFVPDGTAEAATLRKKYELGAIDLCRPQRVKVENQWTAAARAGTHPQFGRQHKLADSSSELPFAEPVATPVGSNDIIEVDLDTLSAQGAPPPLPSEHVVKQPRWRSYVSNDYGESNNRSGAWKLFFATVAALLIIGLIGAGILNRERLWNRMLAEPSTTQNESSEAQSPENERGSGGSATQSTGDSAPNVETFATPQSVAPQVAENPLTGSEQKSKNAAASSKSGSDKSPSASAAVRAKLPEIKDSEGQRDVPTTNEAPKQPLEPISTEESSNKKPIPPSIQRMVCLLPKYANKTEAKEPESRNIELTPSAAKVSTRLQFYYPPHSATYLPLRIVKKPDGTNYNVITSKNQDALRVSHYPERLVISWGSLAANKHIRDCLLQSALVVHRTGDRDENIIITFRNPQKLEKWVPETESLSFSALESLVRVFERPFTLAFPLPLTNFDGQEDTRSILTLYDGNGIPHRLTAKHTESSPLRFEVCRSEDVGIQAMCELKSSKLCRVRFELKSIDETKPAPSDLRRILKDQAKFSSEKVQAWLKQHKLPTTINELEDHLTKNPAAPSPEDEQIWNQLRSDVHFLYIQPSGISVSNLEKLVRDLSLDFKIEYEAVTSDDMPEENSELGQRIKVLFASTRSKDIPKVIVESQKP